MRRAAVATACICARRRASSCELRERPGEALALALANWAVQREPADARIVLEAALAAGEPAAARAGARVARAHRPRGRPDRSAAAGARGGRRDEPASCSRWRSPGSLLAARGRRAQAERQLSQPGRRRAAGSRAAGTSRCATSSTRSASTAMATARSPGASCAPARRRSRPTRSPASSSQRRRRASARRARRAAGRPAQRRRLRGAALRRRLPGSDRRARRALPPAVRPRPAAPRPGPGRARGRDPDRACCSPEQPGLAVGSASPACRAQLASYVREGVWHIWLGLDHILFLLLPAAAGRAAPAAGLLAAGREPRRGAASRSSSWSPPSRSRTRSRSAWRRSAS